MKKIILAVIIFTFSFSYSQISKERFVSNSFNSFKEGEWLQFRVHYGFFNASEIEIKLEKKKLDEVLNLAFKAHKILGCRGVTRSDFKFYKNKFYLLELNTQPGMTKLSLVPEIAAFRGISFYKLLNWIINDASINR